MRNANMRNDLNRGRFSIEFRKVIGLALLRYTIGWKKLQSAVKLKPIVTRSQTFSRHFFIQSAVKPKPIVTHSHAFSRALRHLQYMYLLRLLIGLLYCLCSLWLAGVITLVLRHLIENCSETSIDFYFRTNTNRKQAVILQNPRKSSHVKLHTYAFSFKWFSQKEQKNVKINEHKTTNRFAQVSAESLRVGTSSLILRIF